MASSSSASHNSSTLFTIYTFLFLSSFSFCSARDTITFQNPIIDSDSQGEYLVSARERFELGFFTPNGSSSVHRRYVGIWYYKSSPRVVVWVANRDTPLSKTTGTGAFTIAKDGNLHVLEDNIPLWSAIRGGSSTSFNRTTVKLLDSGNLVLIGSETILWQSFDQPTDTFLPGMKLTAGINLTSWTSQDDPAPGNFTFQEDQVRQNQYIVKKITSTYWKSEVSGSFFNSDNTFAVISYLLSNFSQNTRLTNHTRRFDYNNTRVVMNFSGHIEFYIRVNETASWFLIWSEPEHQCSVFNFCGNFGSCNRQDRRICKCLPGFEPKFRDNWNTENYLDGCIRKSPICIENVKVDHFLSLKMIKVGDPSDTTEKESAEECKQECLSDCICQAYSYESTERSPTCSFWSNELNNIQEQIQRGIDLYVRVPLSDIELTKRDCEPCGTTIIPYPLSIGPDCGDPMYSNFNCSNTTGQVSFAADGVTYPVTTIHPEEKKFIIIVNTNNSRAIEALIKFLELNHLPFNITTVDPSANDEWLDEVEIQWKPPLSPICNSSNDCNDWPHSTCNMTKDGTKRCLCDAKFQWNLSDFNCAPVHDELAGSHRKRNVLGAIIPVIIATLMVIACCFLYYLRRRKVAKGQESVNRERIQETPFRLYDSERRVKDLIDSGQFREDDKKGIDVPFFDLKSILAATDYFSDTKKLGQGGFGPVYKGTFSGGQEIAIKRLSSGSGQGLEEFKNEVVLIAKLQHRNLVKLLGYCIQGDEKILLYEYMPNKSLDSFLFDRTLCVLLNWEIRFDIILGIARGLLYLHQDSRLKIIHRDLKTSNVLLDEEMNPKISDFGLARIFGGKQTEATTTRVVGTYGYMSPEYALDGFFSDKSDVFSFGVVVLEVISGKKNTGFYQTEKALSLLGYAWKLWKEDKAYDLMDQTLRETCKADEFLRCVNVGLLCVQEDPNDRPTMSNVVFMLGSETASLPIPKQAAFVVRRSLSSTASSSTAKPESGIELTTSIEEGR